MKYEGWIIYKKADAMKNSDYIEWFARAAAKEQLHLRVAFRESLAICLASGDVTYHGNPIDLPDFAVVRIMEPFLSGQLERLGVPCFNSGIISTLANDKAMTYNYARSMGIPYLKTFAYPANVFPEHPPLPYPFVMKPTTGKGGTNVCYVDDDAIYEAAKVQLQNEPYVLQAATVQLGKDLRVFVVGNEIITAILRNNERDFRANYTLGGNASVYSLNENERALVESIIATNTFDFVGIDFLIGLDGELIFNEIEDVVGSRTVSHLTDIDIVALYVKRIFETLEKQ